MIDKKHTITSRIITDKRLTEYEQWLGSREKAPATVEKYGRDLRAFAAWLGGSALTQASAADYKQYLLIQCNRQASGVNTAVAALNSFFEFAELAIKLKPLKIQRQTFRPQEKELTKAEYERLLAAAGAKSNERLNLILQTICSTGIRVSELKFITVTAARAGAAQISSKGKTRTVFLPKKLKTLLLSYAARRGIADGPVFVTKSGRPLDRSNIWSDMKKLCGLARVSPEKVFPHNLRHLFARLFYSIDRDITRLADILGHSNINTTRIYLMESGERHRRRVESLNLVMT